MRLRIVGIALFALLFSGCGVDSKALPQPAMAIAPGYIKLDSGKLIQVIGYERCPGAGYALIGRADASNRDRNCTVVAKDAPSFEISVGTTGGMMVERWSVVADSRSIRLVRPDGDGATVFKATD